MMAGESWQSGEPPSSAMRDALPGAADIDRGAIGSIGGSARSNIMRGGAFAAVAAVIGIFFITQTGHGRRDADKSAAETRADATPAKAVVSYEDVAPAAPRLAAAGQDPNAPMLGQGPPNDGPTVPALSPNDPGAAQAARASQRSPAQVMADARRRAPLIAYGGGQGSGRAGPSNLELASGYPLSTPVSGHSDGNEPTKLDRLRRQTSVKQSRAAMIGNRDYLITAGTLIPCVLQTALSSAQPGYTTCIIPQDILSDNGNVVLMEKGTKVLGEYRGGLSQGQNRLFVLWTRALTPQGVAIELGSPGSDALGRAGVAGGVDTFFWARFGGALLLSLVDDGMQVAGQALANRGSNTTQVPSDAAAVALQNSVNIKPVLRKNQGEEVGIFVAQDFNFADVYGLRLRR